MASHDYLSLRLISLKNPEQWAHDGTDLGFIFPRAGSAVAGSGSEQRRLSPGDVMFLSGAAPTQIAALNGGEMAFWYFSANLDQLIPLFGSEDLSNLHSLTKDLNCPKVYPASSPLARECYRLLTDVPPQLDMDHRAQLLRVAAGILRTEFQNFRTQGNGFVTSEDHIKQVFTTLSVFDILNLPVGKLAQRFSCSRRHLNRLFHQQFGLSVTALRMEIRLLRALRLLKSNDGKIIGIAEQCGFNHLGRFNNCFKRRFGFTPGECRKTTVEVTLPQPAAVQAGSCRLQANGLCPLAQKAVYDCGIPCELQSEKMPKPAAVRPKNGVPRRSRNQRDRFAANGKSPVRSSSPKRTLAWRQ